MSGVEIAGLVLGSIPLIISALEHWEELLDPAIAYWKYHGELGLAIKELRNQHASYEQSLELILTQATNDEQRSEMMENSNSHYWKDPDIEEALKTKFGRAYAAYVATTKDIQTIMILLAEKLNIDGAARLSQAGLEAIISCHPKVGGSLLSRFEFRNRIKFTMKRQRITKSLSELQRLIGMLDGYHSKAEQIQSQQVYGYDSKSNFMPSLQNIQRDTANLYHVLAKTWCRTHPTHSAGLLLEHRLWKKPKRGTNGWQGYPKKSLPNTCETDRFGISLLESINPQKWLDVEIRLVESHYPGKTSTIKFVNKGTGPPGPTTATVPYADPSKLAVVTDICAIIGLPRQSCIGFCVDSTGQLRGGYAADQRNIRYVECGVKLADLITNQTSNLSFREQCSLSITLASSLLQLSHTPWLLGSWNKDDILFLRTKNDATSNEVDVQHPYLTREHTPGANTATSIVKPHRNDASKLLALGVMLLEIWNKKPVEAKRKPQFFGPNNVANELTDFQTVKEWLTELDRQGYLTFGVRTAIGYCLKCFADPTASFANEAFVRSIQDEILTPLEMDMGYHTFGPDHFR